MAQVDELLERARKEGISEELGYGALQDAYSEQEWEAEKVKNWPLQIHIFGKRQNQINRSAAARIRALEIQNRTLEIQIQRLEEMLEMMLTKEAFQAQMTQYVTRQDLEVRITRQELDALSEQERSTIARMARNMGEMSDQLDHMNGKLRNSLNDARLRTKLEENARERVQKQMDQVQNRVQRLEQHLELPELTETLPPETILPPDESLENDPDEL